MNQESDRIPCPKCRANNFPTSAVCWNCGQPLHPQQEGAPEEPAAPPQAGPESPSTCQANNTDTLVILGFIMAGLAFIACCCSPIFAIPAIILGATAYSRGDQRGLWVIIIGAIALLFGGGFSLLGHFFGRTIPYVPYGLPGPLRKV